jgi:hypothetical protein
MNELQRSSPTPDPASLAEAPRALMRTLLIKLRWMGMEEEARRVQSCLRRARLSDGMLASEPETD